MFIMTSVVENGQGVFENRMKLRRFWKKLKNIVNFLAENEWGVVFCHEWIWTERTCLFDFVIFVSVVSRRYLGSVHIQITSWIKYLLIISISVSAVPRRYLGTNTNGIAAWIVTLSKPEQFDFTYVYVFNCIFQLRPGFNESATEQKNVWYRFLILTTHTSVIQLYQFDNCHSPTSYIT